MSSLFLVTSYSEGLKSKGLARWFGLWDDCVMGSKDKGRKETKKPPKPKAKAAPSNHTPLRKISGDANQAAFRTIREDTERD
jgi:hypothetical protein